MTGVCVLQTELLGMSVKYSTMAGRALTDMRQAHACDLHTHSEIMCMLLQHSHALPNDRRRVLWTMIMEQRYLRFDHLMLCRMAADELRHDDLLHRIPLASLSR